jgi:fructokinase
LTVFGGIEAGGSKWECAVGTGPDDLRTAETIPTTTLSETIGRAVEFFEREVPVDAVGLGSFGPIDRRRGYITTTPKPGWRETDVAGELHRRLGVPVAFDTDVNAAARSSAASCCTASRIPHDREADPFPGSCPFHGDCWEGLASGPALEARYGRPPHELDDETAWAALIV